VKVVEPIRDIDDIERIKDYLRRNNERDYILFMFGIYTGLRVSDIIPIKVKHILGSRIEIREKKTGKIRSFPINQQLRNALNQYIENKQLKEYDYLFPSRKKKNGNGVKICHISRIQVYKILKEAGEHIGLKNIGTHSMRKTFGYHFYKQNSNITILQQIFNHSTPEITLGYIGYTQEELDQSILTFDY
jgi:gp32